MTRASARALAGFSSLAVWQDYEALLSPSARLPAPAARPWRVRLALARAVAFELSQASHSHWQARPAAPNIATPQANIHKRRINRAVRKGLEATLLNRLLHKRFRRICRAAQRPFRHLSGLECNGKLKNCSWEKIEPFTRIACNSVSKDPNLR